MITLPRLVYVTPISLAIVVISGGIAVKEMAQAVKVRNMPKIGQVDFEWRGWLVTYRQFSMVFVLFESQGGKELWLMKSHSTLFRDALPTCVDFVHFASIAVEIHIPEIPTLWPIGTGKVF